MRESTVRDFLVGDLSCASVLPELIQLVGRDTLQAGQELELDLTAPFQVQPEHLTRIADCLLRGELTPAALSALAFFLVASDNLVWDTRSPEGELIGEILFGWSAPEINEPIAPATVAARRALLERARSAGAG